MYRDEKGHVTWFGLSPYSDEEVVTEFRDVVGDKLSTDQARQLALLLAAKKVMKHVTYEINPGSMTPEEQEAHNAEQAKIRQQIGRAIVGQAAREQKELGL